jgi:hypothetical protein
MSTWSDLRELRRMGRKPALPLYVTTDYRRCWDAHNQGAMIIEHKAGERFEFDLLAGLDVVLYLDECSQTSAVSRRLAEEAEQPKSVRAWCRCEGECNSTCWPNCSVGDECRKAWETLCQTKR